MKKTIKCLFTFALTLTLGMSPGVVKGEEVEVSGERSVSDQKYCEQYCNDCGLFGPHCKESFCNSEDVCLPFMVEFIDCANEDGDECNPFYDTPWCYTKWQNVESCKNLFPVCGDGFPSQDGGGEMCDDADLNADDAACTSECKANVCGDGLVLQDVEECDAGPFNADWSACTSECKKNICGDDHHFIVDLEHVLTSTEMCDDGNNNDGDGCSAACVIEQ